MKAHEIHGFQGGSTVLVGESLENLSRYLPSSRLLVVTDANVRKHHGERFPRGPVIEIGTGERAKTLDTVAEVYRAFLDAGADRTSFVVGIGGGIVCDVAGFAASTYLRGIRFGFVPSTLLAQVDASVGGKNGVNFQGFKNMVGLFRQPRFVLCDPRLLRTLPRREIACGLAEIVKHALIADAALFEYLERNVRLVLTLSAEAVEHLVDRSVSIKAKVVNRDETEAGVRRMLNFGHTFGHAVEALSGQNHGEAVSVGMVLALRMSVARGLLKEQDESRAHRLLQALGLPIRLSMPPEALFGAVQKDKKREGRDIHFVFLKGIGQAVVQPVAVSDLADFLRSLPNT